MSDKTEIEWVDFPNANTCKIYGCQVVYSLDDTGQKKFNKLKHISVSRRHDYPTWKQLLMIKEHFFGDTDTMMVLPKSADYVNLHPNCFHIWQTPTEWGIM